AADPASAGTASGAERRVPAPREQARLFTPPSPRDDDRAPLAQVPPPVAIPTITPPDPVADLARPAATTRAAEAAPITAASHRHEETVEISIGAIHVRVDAPQPSPTIARPA